MLVFKGIFDFVVVSVFSHFYGKCVSIGFSRAWRQFLSPNDQKSRNGHQLVSQNAWFPMCLAFRAFFVFCNVTNDLFYSVWWQMTIFRFFVSQTACFCLRVFVFFCVFLGFLGSFLPNRIFIGFYRVLCDFLFKKRQKWRQTL